jgi:hypothetical protein
VIIFDENTYYEVRIGKPEDKKHLRKWVKVVLLDIWGCGGIAPPLLTSAPHGGE